MKPHRPFELQEYSPTWKEQFALAAEKLSPMLGDNLVEIQHIGSTSITGMLAKPQIDILVVVKDLDAVKNMYSNFSAAGYKIHGRGYVADDDEYISLDDENGKRLISVHILQKGNAKIDEYKIFRDYLNQNEQDRALYIATKKKLYSSHSDNYAEYDGGKKDIIAAIKERAKEWANTKKQA